MATSVYLISGDDEYFVAREATKIVHSLVPEGDRDLGLDIIDGAVGLVDDARRATESCVAALLTLGMFGGTKLVWFKDVSFLVDNKVGKSETVKSAVNKLAAVIKQGLPEGITLVISTPKADKRYAFYKACKAAGELQEFSMPDKAYQVEKYVEEKVKSFAKERGISFPESVKQEFLAKVGSDTRQMVCELDKLMTYMGDRKDVTLDDVKSIVSSSKSSLAWDLADAFGKHDLSLSLSILRQLLFQKESPLGLVMALEGRIRDLMIYKEGISRGWVKKSYNSASWGEVPPVVDQMFSDEYERDPRKIHPFRVGILVAQAERFSRAELTRCHELAMEAHEALVSSTLTQPMTLELMLIKMLSLRHIPRT
ncbi:MAG: DNA polymerase III subunit delta [Kiritimatiellae bacterium]|nr:DNA polymerase III subunit delta [Kiritimatiellia bacterium]